MPCVSPAVEALWIAGLAGPDPAADEDLAALLPCPGCGRCEELGAICEFHGATEEPAQFSATAPPGPAVERPPFANDPEPNVDRDTQQGR